MNKIEKRIIPLASNYLGLDKPAAMSSEAERHARFGARLIGLHLAFARQSPDDLDLSELDGNHDEVGVYVRVIGIFNRHAEFKHNEHHAARHDRNGGGHELLGLRGDRELHDGDVASGALKIYLAMNKDDGNIISEKSLKARAFWKSFLGRQGIDTPSDPGRRQFTDPFAFADQWRALQTQERGVETFGNEILNFDTTAPDLFDNKPLAWKKGGEFFESDEKAARTKEAKQKITEIAVKKKEREQNSFKEQLMLLANIENLVKQNSKHQYEKFSFLRGQPADASLENEVYAFRGKQEFMRMTNLQISALVPYFRMFIVYGSQEFELPFQGTFIDAEEVLKHGRARSLGFQNFDWTYEGKYLETAKKQIESNLRLYGDNLAVFDKTVGTFVPNIEDASKLNFKNFQKNFEAGNMAQNFSMATPRAIKFADLLTRDRDLQFKVQCGWAVPEGAPESLISSDLKSAIDNNIVTLIMELVEHTFEFNQDGTFGLNLRYKSRIMGGLDELDLLSSKKVKQQVADDNRAFELELRKKFSKEVQFNPTTGTKDNSAIFNSDEITSAQIRQFAESHFPNTATDKARTARAINELKQFLSRADIRSQRARASTVIARMIAEKNKNRTGANISRVLTDIEDRGRLMNVEVTTPTFRSYFKNIQREEELQGELNRLKSELSPEEYKIESKRLTRESANEESARRASAANSSISKTVNKGDSNFAPVTSEELNRRVANKNFKLPFVYFGDIIESAISLVGDQYDKEDVTLIMGNMPFKKQVNFQSSVELAPSAKIATTHIQIPLVDVPISLRNYGAWITREYIQKPTSKIDLSSFIIGAFNNLVRPAFSGETDAVKLLESQKSNLAVNSNTFSSDKNLKLGEVPYGGLKSLAISNNPRGKATRNFILFAANQVAQKNKEPTAEELREGKSIHLVLGRDRGLVKTANFSKVSMPNLVAARFMEDSGKNERLDKIKEPYNVDIVMVGNNLFSQGVNFWLSPTIPGEGGQTVARDLGLGGYYVTTQAAMKIDMMTGFTTTLHGKLQNFSVGPEDMKMLNRVAERRKTKNLKEAIKKGAK